MAVADRELVPIERARCGAGGAVSFGVELAAVAGAAEAGRLRGNERDEAGACPLAASLVGEEGAVRLGWAPDVRAAARHDREARLVADEAVVPHVGGPSCDLSHLGVGKESGDDELALRERVDRAEVDRSPPLPEERGQDCEADRRKRDAESDNAAESERRALEQPAPGIPLLVGGRWMRLGRSA